MKFYIDQAAPNGTSNLIIADAWDQIIAVLDSFIFGDRHETEGPTGWTGDRLGNINACLYGECITMIGYEDLANPDGCQDHQETDPEDHCEECNRSMSDAVMAGEYSDIDQVMEISFRTAFENIAVSPVTSHNDSIDKLIAVCKEEKGGEEFVDSALREIFEDHPDYRDDLSFDENIALYR